MKIKEIVAWTVGIAVLVFATLVAIGFTMKDESEGAKFATMYLTGMLSGVRTSAPEIGAELATAPPDELRALTLPAWLAALDPLRDAIVNADSDPERRRACTAAADALRATRNEMEVNVLAELIAMEDEKRATQNAIMRTWALLAVGCLVVAIAIRRRAARRASATTPAESRAKPKTNIAAWVLSILLLVAGMLGGSVLWAGKSTSEANQAPARHDQLPTAIAETAEIVSSATPAELRDHELPDSAPRTRAKVNDIVNADSDAKRTAARKAAIAALQKDGELADAELANDAWRAWRRFETDLTNGLTVVILLGIGTLVGGILIWRRAREHSPAG